MKKTLLLLTFALLSLALPSRARAQAMLTIQNESDWDIYYIHISLSTETTWGDDLMGDQVLYSGSSQKFNFSQSGLYDIKLIDEEEDECIIFEQRLGGNQTWKITNEELLKCMAN